jgi:predicted acetyltransferase
MELVRPAIEHLASYQHALERRWSPDSLRPQAATEELAEIAADCDAFLASMDDPTGSGPQIVLPGGRAVPRLPGVRRWMWDGEFCGTIGLRWQPGTADLPPYCLGHIGYSVVPWKRNRGYATAALHELLPCARSVGLPFVEVTTDVVNLASQRVIAANGGVVVERFDKPAAYGGAPSLRFRIALAEV